MKTIVLQRAATKKTGKLVNGTYLEIEKVLIDAKGNEWEVKPDTVKNILCFDVHGKPVFEGDDVKSTTSVVTGPVYYGEAPLSDGQLIGSWFFKGIALKIDANLNCKNIELC